MRNAAGAALVLVSLMAKFNFGAFIVESFWLLTSLIPLVRRRSAGGGSNGSPPS
jgi:hypothetical protein